MNRLLLLATALLLAGGLQAQDGSAENGSDEADVWAMVEAQWNSDENGDREWPDRLLSDDFSGWSKDSPAPRDKASIRMWDRFSEQEGIPVAHELYPYRIVVHGDVAVAHYFFSSAFKSKDGEISRSNGRFTDILVRTADGWRFLAWHGGDD